MSRSHTSAGLKGHRTTLPRLGNKRGRFPTHPCSQRLMYHHVMLCGSRRLHKGWLDQSVLKDCAPQPLPQLNPVRVLWVQVRVHEPVLKPEFGMARPCIYSMLQSMGILLRKALVRTGKGCANISGFQPGS